MDTLIYDPERLACTAEEKEACLETVAKLARLCKYTRREGQTVVYDLAEKESDPFFRACLLEYGDVWQLAVDEEEQEAILARILCAHLAAGNYRGGAFLNAVLVVKGLLLSWKHWCDHPSTWRDLLSAELRGFFGVEYRERVVDVIIWETRAAKASIARESCLIPEFERFTRLDLPRRQALLRETKPGLLAIALRYVSKAAETAVLEALTDGEQMTLEKEYLAYTHCLRVIDISQAQEDLLKQWGLVKPGEELKAVYPERNDGSILV